MRNHSELNTDSAPGLKRKHDLLMVQKTTSDADRGDERRYGGQTNGIRLRRSPGAGGCAAAQEVRKGLDRVGLFQAV
ncbi:unnamed protein product [Arctogadus glacialis]